MYGRRDGEEGGRWQTAAIVAEGLGKRFGPVVALDGVDLELPAGRVLGVLGPNGAGKTTLVRILATLLKPDQGRARVAGFDVAAAPGGGAAADRAVRAVRRGGPVPDRPGEPGHDRPALRAAPAARRAAGPGS